MANKPIWSKKSNNISICEWKNEDKTSYSLGKRYNKNGQWVDAKIYYDTDLPIILGLVLAAISRESVAQSNAEAPKPPAGEPPAAVGETYESHAGMLSGLSKDSALGKAVAETPAVPSVASDDDIPF